MENWQIFSRNAGVLQENDSNAGGSRVSICTVPPHTAPRDKANSFCTHWLFAQMNYKLHIETFATRQQQEFVM